MNRSVFGGSAANPVRLVVACAAIFLVLLVSGGTTQAQTINVANISGIVRDTTGAVVPGAEVNVWNRDTGLKRDATTGEGGVYTVSSLP